MKLALSPKFSVATWYAISFVTVNLCPLTARGDSIEPMPAILTKVQKDAIFSHWTNFKHTEADQSFSLTASVDGDKFVLTTSGETVLRSSTVKTETTCTVKVEDIVSAKRFGKLVLIEAKPNSIRLHSVVDRVQDRSKTLLEDSHANETKQCGDFSFSFETSSEPEVLAGAAAEDISNYVKRKKTKQPEPLLGRWEWGYYNGKLAQWTTLAPDGVASSTNNTSGHWRVVSELERIYEIKWDVYGWVNVVHVSPDHNKLVEDYYNRGHINSRNRAVE